MVACPSGSCVSLKVNVDDGSDYLIPGQYVQVRPADGTYSIYIDFVFYILCPICGERDDIYLYKQEKQMMF